MKRVWLSICLLISPVCLASSVTTYGILDGGVQISKAPGESTLVQMANGYQSGNRLGIKGVEDLGRGYSVFFQLEQGFKLNNGNEHKSGFAFSRQASIGFKGSFGELSFGRLGALSSDCGTYSILPPSIVGTSYSSKANSYSALILTDRYNNVIVYKTPTIGGFTFSAMYSNGTGADTEKWSLNNHYYGLGAVYAKAKLTLTGILEYIDNKAQNFSDGRKSKGTQFYTFGAGYDFGFMNLAVTYQFANKAMVIENYLQTSDFISKNVLKNGARQHAFVLSADAPLWGGRAGLQFNYANGKFLDSTIGKKDYSTVSLGGVYTYSFSKRTNLYSFTGYGATRKALRTAAANSIRGYSIAVGLRHKF